MCQAHLGEIEIDSARRATTARPLRVGQPGDEAAVVELEIRSQQCLLEAWVSCGERHNGGAIATEVAEANLGESRPKIDPEVKRGDLSPGGAGSCR
jgi:hypothetical protein